MTNTKPITHTESSEKKRPVELTITFRVEKFGPLIKSYKSGECLCSEGVSSELMPRAVWELEIYPNGWIEEHKGNVCVNLCLTGPMADNGETLDATYRTCIVDASDNKIDVVERETRNFGEEYYGWGEDVDHERVKKALQTDGSLRVVAEVKFLPYHDGDVTALSESNLHAKWCNSIGKLLETVTNSDCTIVVGGEQLKAHRLVLSAISPTFAEMFGNEAYEEANNGVVRIEDSPGMLKDSSAKPYRALLFFAYTGRVDWMLFGDCKRDVLVVACKYLVADLKHHVEEMLINEIDTESFTELVLLADNYSCDALKEACVKYLSRNPAVMFTPQWEVLAKTKVDLSFELLRLVRESKAAADE